MAVSLSPETERRMDEWLRRGDYPDADTLVTAALDALAELESTPLDEPTLDALDEAEDQIDGGEVYDWKDVRDGLRARFVGPVVVEESSTSRAMFGIGPRVTAAASGPLSSVLGGRGLG